MTGSHVVSAGIPATAADPDLDLVRQALAGDPSAMRALDARVAASFRRCFARSAARSPALRSHQADLLQAFRLHLIKDGGRALRSYSGRASLGAWLNVVAGRFIRRRGPPMIGAEVLDGREPDLADPRGGPERAAIDAVRVAALRAAVKRLPKRDQLLLSLLYEEEVPAHEVGRSVGLTASGVRMRKARLLRQLERQLAGLRDLDV